MTPEEAIKIINELLTIQSDGYYEYLSHGGTVDGHFEDEMNAFDMAIKALEKQIPKKPNETEAYPHRLYCPNCYFTFCFNKDNLDGIKALQMYNYCPDCGQAIDWSDSE